MSTLADPEEVDRLAGAFELQASELCDVGAAVQRDAQASTWTSPRAERFRWEAQGHRQEAEAAAGELQQLARQLRAEAEQIRAELRELARLEATVRSALETAPGRMLGRWHPANLPPSRDTSWRQVAAELGFS